MEKDPRGRKKGFFGGPLSRGRGLPLREDMSMYNRRVLKNYDLKPPKYIIKPQYLLEENVEKIVRYAGMIDDATPYIDIDMTNRTEVLRVIDKGKKEGVIPPNVGPEHDAIFSISVNNIKISRYNQTEDLLLRIPMHEIAALCYIKDDGQHILTLKHGTPDACSFSIVFCETKRSAEELCMLICQCFDLVYTDVTVKDFKSKFSGSNGAAANIMDPMPQFISGSTSDLPTSPSDSVPTRHHGSRRSTHDSDLSIHSELVKDYIIKLKSKLNDDEMRNFADLIRDWFRPKLALGEFCEKVYQLYGPERKHLLGEMGPFIPSLDYDKFKTFLGEHGIPIQDNGTMSSLRSNIGIYTRSVSELSTASTISNGDSDGVEQILNMVTDHIAQLNASVDVDTNPDNFLNGIDNFN